MPQLMPLYWNMSLFMIMFIMLIMVMLYFIKLLDFDLFCFKSDSYISSNSSNVMFFSW